MYKKLIGALIFLAILFSFNLSEAGFRDRFFNKEYDRQERGDSIPKERKPKQRMAISAFQASSSSSNMEIGKRLTEHQINSTFSNCWSKKDELLFLSDRDGKFELYKMSKDGSGVVKLTEDGSLKLNACYSREGDRIAYAYYDAKRGKYVLMLMDATGANKREVVSFSDKKIKEIEISPDESKIVFEVYDSGDKINIIDVNGANLKKLAEGKGAGFFPDGKKIIYYKYQDGEDKIYKIDLDGTNNTFIVKGSEPLISPDGNWIAYQESCGSISIVKPDGREQKKLVDAGDYIEDFSWSYDSKKIYFSLEDKRMLFAVDLTGKKEEIGKIASIENISPSPDGKYLLYDNLKDIWLLNLENKTYSNLTNNSLIAFYRSPVWSADGRKLAFVGMPNKDADGQKAGDAIWIMDKDGSNKKEIYATDKFFNIGISISSDGSKIAFSPEEDEGIYNIYVINSNGTNLKKLTSDGKSAGAVLSPNGEKIVYNGHVNNNCGLCIMDVDGGNKKVLENLNYWGGGPSFSWSPKGDYIAYYFFNSQENKSGIAIIKPDGSGKIILTTDNGKDPIFSPDGSMIAYRKGESIYIVKLSNPMQPFKVYESKDYEIEAFCWSPDSKKIAFCQEEEYTNLFTIDIDGKNLTNLGQLYLWWDEMISWSRDNILAFANRWDIWVKDFGITLNWGEIRIYNFENPFNPKDGKYSKTTDGSLKTDGTIVKVILPQLGKLSYKIYNIAGEQIIGGKIETIKDTYYIPWEGKNAEEQYVATGIYLFLAEVEYHDGKKDKAVCKIAVTR